MLVLGLLLLAGAVIVGVAGVAANTGSEHQLAGGFGIFGYHVHGSSGKLFLAGLVIGAVAMLGFIMATEGLRRNAALRRELFRFRRQARTQARPVTPAPAPTPAPQPREPVLARTAPTKSSDADVTSTGAGAGSGTRAGTGAGTTTGTGSAANANSNAADGSAESSGWRRTLRNWRTPRPTS
jgi:hypothetical protein